MEQKPGLRLADGLSTTTQCNACEHSPCQRNGRYAQFWLAFFYMFGAIEFFEVPGSVPCICDPLSADLCPSQRPCLLPRRHTHQKRRTIRPEVISYRLYLTTSDSQHRQWSRKVPRETLHRSRDLQRFLHRLLSPLETVIDRPRARHSDRFSACLD